MQETVPCFTIRRAELQMFSYDTFLLGVIRRFGKANLIFMYKYTQIMYIYT